MRENTWVGFSVPSDMSLLVSDSEEDTDPDMPLLRTDSESDYESGWIHSRWTRDGLEVDPDMPLLRTDSDTDTDSDMEAPSTPPQSSRATALPQGGGAATTHRQPSRTTAHPLLALSDSEDDSATESSGGARTNETGEVAQGDGEDVAADYYTACSSSVSPERGPRGCVHDRDSDWEGWCTSDEELTRDGFCSDCRPTRPPEGEELQRLLDFFRQQLL